MARYRGPKEKIERRLGIKLFLKGERSYSQKSAMTRRPYPPGAHGKTMRRRMSEYGLQLQSKQRVRNIYRLLEKQFKNLVKKAIESKEESGEAIVHKLESRLDNAVFRSGFAQSRDQARQIVNHGHITVNGKKVDIPSFIVKKNNIIGVRENSKKLTYFSVNVIQWIGKYEPPKWLQVDKNKFLAKVSGVPTMEEIGVNPSDLRLIIEFYSR